MTPEEVQHKIKARCDEWLNPMGYSLHVSTQMSLMYSNDNPDANWPWPIVECCISGKTFDNRIEVNLIAGGRIGLCSIRTNNLQFRHPNIKELIARLRYISNCIQSASTNPLAQYHIKNLIQEME